MCYILLPPSCGEVALAKVKNSDYSFFYWIYLDKGDDIMSKLDDVGKGMQGLGCLLMLLPILGILLYFIFNLLTS